MSKNIVCTYPEHVAWRIELNNMSDAYQAFGKKTANKIKSAIARLAGSQYRFVIEPVTLQYIDRFLPLYQAHIATKDHPHFFDVKSALLPRMTEYRAVSLYDEDTYLGGLIFHNYTDHLASAYKFFPRTLECNLPINITFVAEYYFYEYAIQNQLSYISHGSGKNCWGIHTAIGVAMFKLQAGNRPRYSERTGNQLLHNFVWNGQEDVLILEGESGYLSKGKLLLTGKNPLDRYNILLNHPQLEIKINYWHSDLQTGNIV